jgi:predicted amidohydrolase
MLESDGDRIFNAVAFIGPSGLAGHYRKIHLPYLGVDRFVTPGDRPFRVYDTPVGRVGINICYDVSFPESARVMTLQGAELIALPTNWPVGADRQPEYVINTRAFENRINYIAVNRVGRERGFTFIGQSKIVDYTGKTLASGSRSREEILYADIDLAGARNKHIVNVPREYELDRIRDRRTEFYTILTQPENP